VRLFWELTKLGIRRQLTYRAATLAGLATNFFFGLLRAAVMIALFGSQEQVAGISIQAAVTYTGITQAIIAHLSFFGWYEVMQSVYAGEIGSDLLRPMNFFSYWMAQDLGRAVVSFLMRGLSIMGLYALFFDITIPTHPSQWLALFVAVVLSWLVSFSWRFLTNLAAFWTPNAIGIVRFGFGLTWVFSGFIMPLRLFPDWFVRLCNLTPFPSMVNTVTEVYLGVIEGPALIPTILTQVMWTLFLIAASQVVLRAGVRRLVIQGG
jgi:ABC-2 type transport system permease protein